MKPYKKSAGGIAGNPGLFLKLLQFNLTAKEMFYVYWYALGVKERSILWLDGRRVNRQVADEIVHIVFRRLKLLRKTKDILKGNY